MTSEASIRFMQVKLGPVAAAVNSRRIGAGAPRRQPLVERLQTAIVLEP